MEISGPPTGKSEVMVSHLEIQIWAAFSPDKTLHNVF